MEGRFCKSLRFSALKGKAMLIFQNHTLDEACAHAVREYPMECCGVLLGLREAERRSVYQVVPTRNSAGPGRKQTHFAIDPLELVRIENFALEQGWEIVGFYHSHPDQEAAASQEDIAHMIAGYSYLILSVRSGTCGAVRSYEKSSQQGLSIRREKIKT